MARRVALPPPVAYLPKASLGSTAQSDINGVLKQLKTCTRRLQTALASHALELQVLERLYYKGKNQHRTELFWRSVVEIRRYGTRVEEMQLYGLVETMRVAFWGEAALQNSKLLKGPWTHAPDASLVTFVLRRCSEGCLLLEKAQDRFSSAYHSFTLVMQTAAFLQLILTLAAITSRLSELLNEVQSCMKLTQDACCRLLQNLDPELARSGKLFPSHQPPPQIIPIASDIQVEQSRYTPDRVVLVDEDVDIGSVLVRHTTTSANESPLPSVLPVDSAPSDPTPSLLEDLNMVSSKIVTSVRTNVARESRTSSIGEPVHTVVKRKGTGETQHKKVKKKKRDEIDDIFGP